MEELLRFVGDPYVDAGVAVLEVRLNKAAAEFSQSDLRRQADELRVIYARKAWSGYLTVHFPNSCWCNATMGAEIRRKKQDSLLDSFEAPAIPGRWCVYCGRSAQHIADRSIIPLLTGAATMTSGPGGEPGLPVCSGCQFAIQFYPLAALKVNGRPLFWWTLQHEWMFALTRSFVLRVEQIVEASPEQVPSIGWPPTRLIETAEGVFQEFSGRDALVMDLVGCHATNYGSGPDYEEYRLNRSLLEFLKKARQYAAYRTIRDSSWEAVKTKKTGSGQEESRAAATEFRRNFFYEDLGKLLRGGAGPYAGLVSRYFRPYAGKVEGVFEVACLFARKVLGMTQRQVEAIQDLAGRIAASAQAEKYLERLFQRRGLLNYIRTLSEISDRMKRSEETPLPTQTILDAFDLTNEDDTVDRGGSLVRELILLRLIETLPREKLETLPQLESNESEGQE